MRLLVLLLLTLGLAACVPGGQTPEPGAIQETALPPPTGIDGGQGDAPSGAQPPGPQDPVEPQSGPAPEASPGPEPQPEAQPEAQPMPEAAPAPPPEPPILARQRAACADEGGQLIPRGSGFFACVHQTRDAGQRCDEASDCTGLCLARSGTCAPLHPLFGCHEVFTVSGRRETLCTD